MSERKPAMAFAPGEYLLSEINARGMTAAEFCKKSGLDWDYIGKLLFAETRVTKYAARQIADVFGTSAELWLNLQKAYDNRKQEASDD